MVAKQCSSKILKELISIEEKIQKALVLAKKNDIHINSDQILKKIVDQTLKRAS